jgi:hypothetical protein
MDQGSRCHLELVEQEEGIEIPQLGSSDGSPNSSASALGLPLTRDDFDHLFRCHLVNLASHSVTTATDYLEHSQVRTS